MNGFVATGNAAPTVNIVIKNSTFWPDIETAAAREAMRMTSTITDARLKAALVDAMASVNHEAPMRAWRTEQQSAGAATLADVEAEEIDGESVQIQRYRRAVYCLAKASVQERYRDYDTTRDGQKAAETLDEQPDTLRRDARWAIRDLLGHARSTIELI